MSPPGPDPQPHAPPAVAASSTVADSPRHAVVLLMILTTAVLFVSLFAVLYFRWADAQEPSSALVVKTTPAFEGVEIVVEGVALREPYRVRIGDRNRTGTIPFYLDRGSYTLRLRNDDREIYSFDFIIEVNRMVQVDLSRFEHLLPAGGATTQTSTTG